MDDEGIKLARALVAERNKQRKRFMSLLRKVSAENLTAAQKKECDRIKRELEILQEAADRDWKALDPLVNTDREEYLSRSGALVERHAEMYLQLTKDLARLLITKAATD